MPKAVYDFRISPTGRITYLKDNKRVALAAVPKNELKKLEKRLPKTKTVAKKTKKQAAKTKKPAVKKKTSVKKKTKKPASKKKTAKAAAVSAEEIKIGAYVRKVSPTTGRVGYTKNDKRIALKDLPASIKAKFDAKVKGIAPAKTKKKAVKKKSVAKAKKPVSKKKAVKKHAAKKGKGKCYDVDDPLECESGKLCSAKSGRCIMDVARNRSGKMQLLVGDRIIVGSAAAIAALAKNFPGSKMLPATMVPSKAPSARASLEEVSTESLPGRDYSVMKVTELKQECSRRGYKCWKMKKAEIIDLLEEDDAKGFEGEITEEIVPGRAPSTIRVSGEEPEEVVIPPGTFEVPSKLPPKVSITRPRKPLPRPPVGRKALPGAVVPVPGTPLAVATGATTSRGILPTALSGPFSGPAQRLSQVMGASSTADFTRMINETLEEERAPSERTTVSRRSVPTVIEEVEAEEVRPPIIREEEQASISELFHKCMMDLNP